MERLCSFRKLQRLSIVLLCYSTRTLGIFFFISLILSDHTSCRHQSFFCTFLLDSLSERVSIPTDSQSSIVLSSMSHALVPLVSWFFSATGGCFWQGFISGYFIPLFPCICFKICRPCQSTVSFSDSHKHSSSTTNHKLRHRIPIPVHM